MLPKKILLGVTGSIAAYKACELVRLLKKKSHEVKVVMTQGAQQFVHKNTFEALSGNKVFSGFFDECNSMQHIDLARWADVIIIAPATAEFLSKLSIGSAENLLLSLCLAQDKENKFCYIAPAMNCFMWKNKITQGNCSKLKNVGYKLLPTEHGEQVCGDVGDGRMIEPSAIVKKILSSEENNFFKNKTILISAGPTHEKIDPVRFIGNYSSGRMGYALAKAAQSMGARVVVVSGPCFLEKPLGCVIINVNTAAEMLDAVDKNIFKYKADIFISSAAVADYYLEKVSESKIKKTGNNLVLNLTRTPDILKAIRAMHEDLFIVGFCAETDNLLENAKKKLQNKKLNMIVANQVIKSGYPFGAETNKVVCFAGGKKYYFSCEKIILARKLLNIIEREYLSKAQ